MNQKQFLQLTDEGILKEIESIKWLYKQREVIRAGQSRTEEYVTESVPEHVFDCLMLVDYFAPLDFPNADINTSRVKEILQYHDLREVLVGDTPRHKKIKENEAAEQEATNETLNMVPSSMKSYISNILAEYDGRDSIESQYAHAIDSVEPALEFFGEKGKLRFLKFANADQTLFDKLHNHNLQAATNFPALRHLANTIGEYMKNNGYISK